MSGVVLVHCCSNSLRICVHQVFHRTPAYEDGSLCPGDELVTVNEVTLRGLSRKQAADIIQGEKVRKNVSVVCPDENKKMVISM